MATQHIGRRRELANTFFAVGRSGLCAIEEEDAGDAAVRYDQQRRGMFSWALKRDCTLSTEVCTDCCDHL